jgi:hypothetical protein
MCDKCKKVDERIEHYRRIHASITDQLTVDRIKELIVGLEAQEAVSTPSKTTKAASLGGLPP